MSATTTRVPPPASAIPWAGDRGRLAALLILIVAAAPIGGALASQVVWGLQPCKLCLWQRWPFYLGLPLAALTALVPAGTRRRRLGLAGLALLFLASVGLGGFHAGVEWGWWAGPSDCGGAAMSEAASVDDFLSVLQRTRVVSCTDAAIRVLGLSLAGWNAVISAALAALAAGAAARRDV